MINDIWGILNSVFILCCGCTQHVTHHWDVLCYVLVHVIVSLDRYCPAGRQRHSDSVLARCNVDHHQITTPPNIIQTQALSLLFCSFFSAFYFHLKTLNAILVLKKSACHCIICFFSVELHYKLFSKLWYFLAKVKL